MDGRHFFPSDPALQLPEISLQIGGENGFIGSCLFPDKPNLFGQLLMIGGLLQPFAQQNLLSRRNFTGELFLEQ